MNPPGGHQETVLTGYRQQLDMLHDQKKKLALILELLAKCSATEPKFAKEIASEALRLATTEQNLDAAAESLLYRGRCSFILGNNSNAQADLNDAFSICLDIRLFDLAATVATELGNIATACNDYHAMLRWYRQALGLGKQSGNRRRIGDVLERLGETYITLGDTVSSLEYLLDCLTIREELLDKQGGARVMHSIGIVYGQNADYDAAYDYFRKSLEVFRETGNRYQEVQALVNIGSVYYCRNELDKALEYGIRALTVCEALNEKGDVAAVLMTVGNIYEQKGELNLALSFQRRALEELREAQDEKIRVAALVNLGRLYRRLNSCEDARVLLEHGIAIARHVEDKQGEGKLHHELSLTLDMLGDYRGALRHYRQHTTIREEIAGEEKQKEIVALQARYDIEKAEREREIYRLKAEQLSADVDRKQSELTAIALSLIRKNELLARLRTHIRKLEQMPNGEASSAIKSLLNDIDDSIGPDEHMHVFNERLGRLYRDFTRTLSERYPSLSRTELQICSLFRLNLSTKEIASLLYITVRTVQTHRANIRRKMNLAADVNFEAFMAML